MRYLGSLLLFVLLLPGLCSSVLADSGQGTSGQAVLYSRPGINGFVKDARTGEGIDSVIVIITTSSGATYETTSSETGTFSYPSVPAGPFNVSASKATYRSDTRSFNSSQPCCLAVMSLMPADSNCVSLSDGLTICASEMVEEPPLCFTLTGNVNINRILCFDGPVFVDKRPSLYYPEVSGNCAIHASEIPGGNVTLKGSAASFVYYAQDNMLIPKSFAGIVPGSIFIAGFEVSLGQFIIDPEGKELEVKVIAQMPFPIDKIMEFVQEESSSPFAFVQEASFSTIYSKTQGVNYAGNLSDLSCNFGIFAIEEAGLYFNSATQLFGGGFKIKIPGRTSAEAGESGQRAAPDTLPGLPVIVMSEEGEVLDSLGFNELLSDKRFFNPEFFSAGVQIEFLEGAINKLILTLGVKIPIANTGLFITELTGGVENMVSADDWRIIASIDVETGLELPVLGSPLKLNDFGVNIHPLNYLRGEGAFEVFGYEVSDGFIEFDGRKMSLAGEANLNIADIVIGKAYLTIRSGEFSGGGEFTYKTPSNLPWGFGWAENFVFNSAKASFYNYDIKAQLTYLGLSLAQRIQFGNPSFPWFHYYIGTDYDNLVQIWKGTNTESTTLQFQVPPNCPELLIVAGDTIDFLQADFTLTDPAGRTYDGSNTMYNYFAASSQTVMVVEDPVPGDWTFLSASDHLKLALFFRNQPPTALITMPQDKASASGNISLAFTDYADTLTVRVFYDTDDGNFDGTFIREFTVQNNAGLEFDWQDNSLPEGEYYIYCLVDDGRNTPVMQYAPGSIQISHGGFALVPQGVTANQSGDTLVVGWNDPQDPDVAYTTVYAENISSGIVREVTVTEPAIAVVTGLEPGHAYRVWCCFVSTEMERGPQSDEQEFVLLADGNNAPYFSVNPDTAWKLVAGTPATFTLSAGDADGDSLVYGIPGDTLGIYLAGGQLSWNPAADQRGVYRVRVVVSDGTASDTAFLRAVVYAPDQAAVKVSFSSLTLYELDQKFVKVRNYHCPLLNVQAVVRNLSSGDSLTVDCRRVDDFSFIGRFELSCLPDAPFHAANGDTLMLSYHWEGQEYTAKARYDSLPQPYDKKKPAPVSDLQAISLGNNRLKLIWTATGNDSLDGRAYKYDIRYAGAPLSSENAFQTANRIMVYPYPALAGCADSLILSLDTLAGVMQADTLWFGIKAEDEMQNRSSVSNSPYCLPALSPSGIAAAMLAGDQVSLNWTGSSGSPFFEAYRVFRKMDNGPLLLLNDTVHSEIFTDDLFGLPDAVYTYAVQAVYQSAGSDTIQAAPLHVDRFSDVIALCQLEAAGQYDSVLFTMTGLDSLYGQTFIRTTGSTGLVLLANVYHAAYAVSLSRDGYVTLADTISIDRNNSSFIFTLLSTTLPRLVGGTLTYANSQATPMEDVLVRLMDVSGNPVDSAVTGPAGVFAMSAVPGDYTLQAVCTLPWGGVNAIDGLLILKHFAAVSLLEGIFIDAANVNGDLSVNAVDALLCVQRFAQFITGFVVGDYLFRPEEITVLPGQELQLSLKGLCWGDVNGSYAP